MIEHPKVVPWGEGEANAFRRGVDEPLPVDFLNGIPQSWSPSRQISRVLDVGVYLVGGTVDALAYVPGFRSHAAIMLDAPAAGLNKTDMFGCRRAGPACPE